MRRPTILILALVAAATSVALATAAPPAHRHDMAAMGGTTSQALASQLADARVATAKYATNLALAKKQGYGVITQMIPDMGWHFMNPKITGFDVEKPAILVYGKRGARWQRRQQRTDEAAAIGVQAVGAGQQPVGEGPVGGQVLPRDLDHPGGGRAAVAELA